MKLDEQIDSETVCCRSTSETCQKCNYADDSFIEFAKLLLGIKNFYKLPKFWWGKVGDDVGGGHMPRSLLSCVQQF